MTNELWAPIINDPVYGYEHVNVSDQEQIPSSLLNWTRRILEIRREHKAFGRGTIEFILPENPLDSGVHPQVGRRHHALRRQSLR